MTNQLTRADLEGMTPDEILEAKAEGRCDALLGVPPEDTGLVWRARHGTKPLSRDDLARLNQLGHYDLVLQADKAGRTPKEGNDQ